MYTSARDDGCGDVGWRGGSCARWTVNAIDFLSLQFTPNEQLGQKNFQANLTVHNKSLEFFLLSFAHGLHLGFGCD